MRYAHSVEKVRAAEGALMARVPEGALMQRAAAGLASVCVSLLGKVYGARVLLLVGSGDNGGDALYAGTRLARRGARVTAVLAAPKAHDQGLAALREAGGWVLAFGEVEALLAADGGAVEAFAGTDLVIDGLIGIGGRGALRGRYALLVRDLPEDAIVVACDVPSGVDADTGEVEGEAVRADVTVTFGTVKPGLLIDPGASHAGVVELVDIGLALPEPDVVGLATADVRLPRPGAESDKYRRGVVGILAGGADFTGAAVLAVGAALHAGAGMVRFASVEPVVQLVRQRWPEAVTTILRPEALTLEPVGRVQSWVVGPGLGTDSRARRLVHAALESDVPVLVDADGLNILAGMPGELRRTLLDRSAPTVLTPHAGELSRLLDADRADIEARRLTCLRRAVDELGVTVLLKGSTTLIAEPGTAPVRVNLTGTPWLATAGTGDVLSGLIGALLATGLPPAEAAAYGAHLHGLSARLAATPNPTLSPTPITAFDVLTTLPTALARLPRPLRPPQRPDPPLLTSTPLQARLSMTPSPHLASVPRTFAPRAPRFCDWPTEATLGYWRRRVRDPRALRRGYRAVDVGWGGWRTPAGPPPGAGLLARWGEVLLRPEA